LAGLSLSLYRARAEERLTTMIFATSAVNLAFNDFYGQLSDAQKKHVDNVKR